MASVGNYCWQVPLLISRAARIVGNESAFVMLRSDCEVNIAGYDSYDDLSVFVILSVNWRSIMNEWVFLKLSIDDSSCILSALSKYDPFAGQVIESFREWR